MVDHFGNYSRCIAPQKVCRRQLPRISEYRSKSNRQHGCECEITLPILTHFTLASPRQNGYTQSGVPHRISRTESRSVIRILKRVSVPCASILSLILWATAATAEPQSAPAAPATPAPFPASTPITIELNKLETAEKGCRAYVVLNNTSDTAYQSFKIDLVLFQTDGVIGRRFSIDLAPLRPQKKSVKLFEIDGIACDKIGSLLINDVMECKAATGPLDNCLQNLKTSTLTNVQLSK